MPPIANLILYCRAGFENECAAEIADVAAALGVPGYCKAKPSAGYVLYVPHDPVHAADLRNIGVDQLVFARQVVLGVEFLNQLPVTDRLQAVLPAIQRLGREFGDLRLETADTNEAKELSVFCRKFAAPLRQALQKGGVAVGTAGTPNLHLFFLSSTAVHLAGPSRIGPRPGSWGFPA